MFHYISSIYVSLLLSVCFHYPLIIFSFPNYPDNYLSFLSSLDTEPHLFHSGYFGCIFLSRHPGPSFILSSSWLPFLFLYPSSYAVIPFHPGWLGSILYPCCPGCLFISSSGCHRLIPIGPAVISAHILYYPGHPFRSPLIFPLFSILAQLQWLPDGRKRRTMVGCRAAGGAYAHWDLPSCPGLGLAVMTSVSFPYLSHRPLTLILLHSQLSTTYQSGC